MHPAYDGQMHTQMELLAEFSLPYAQELPTADAHHALESGTASDIHSCHAPAYDYVYDYEDSLHSLQVSRARATRDLRDWPNWNVACYSLNGRRAAHFRQHMATLLEKCLDADIGLADNITDRALQAHMADLNAAKEASTGNVGEIPGSNPETAPRNWVRSSSRQAHHPSTTGSSVGSQHAVTGMPTETYRQVQFNLQPKEAAREAFSDSMLGMTGTIDAVVHDNSSRHVAVVDGPAQLPGCLWVQKFPFNLAYAWCTFLLVHQVPVLLKSAPASSVLL